MKAEVDKLGNNNLINIKTCLNNLKTKVDDLDADKLKTAPVDLKQILDAVDIEVTKKNKIQHTKDKSK